MSLKVIKFVAGGGKTTEAMKIFKKSKRCIYLAFNNKVVDEISQKGFLSKTIDSLFVSFIIPKLINLIPLISNTSKIKYFNKEKTKNASLSNGVPNINLKNDGFLYNKNSKTCISLSMENIELHKRGNFPNSIFIKHIFQKDKLVLSDQMRKDLSNYLLLNYNDKIAKIMEERFDIVIIDEAQDLKDYYEKFAQILSETNLEVYVFGDDFQNINGGGDWFENLESNEYKSHSYRCPEENCRWIRENLQIEIYGTNNGGGIYKIDFNEAHNYDDKNRVLLYYSSTKATMTIIDAWTGPKYTIKKAKGMTIDQDIVIIGKELNLKNFYTAITRTRKKCFTTATLK